VVQEKKRKNKKEKNRENVWDGVKNDEKFITKNHYNMSKK